MPLWYTVIVGLLIGLILADLPSVWRKFWCRHETLVRLKELENERKQEKQRGKQQDNASPSLDLSSE